MGEERDTKRYPYLASLNDAQLRAVTSPPDVPLQILAGPGSGKTRVLTSRVAHLVKCHKYKPYEVTAVTFTNKAANEMRKRLQVLLGDKEAAQLVLGTFHATCAKYLRRYGARIELDNNFAIADADDCKKIMTRLLKARAEQLTQAHMKLKEGAVLSEISKAKAKGETPEGMAIRAAKEDSTTSVLPHIALLYREYELELREAGALDFDDLLVFGLRLFKEHPEILQTCRHILVDEFQDTNTTQYQLMRCFAKAHLGVSVVGDPDQSIYGWRSAEIENLSKMTSDFDGVQSIYLEHNYRSTGAILAASHSIVAQDSKRIAKSLYTSHPQCTPVTLKRFANSTIEASFISTEIKRLVAYSGGTLNYDDFSVLLRYNALSRAIESALQKDGIPSRVIGGHKFFERMEIKDLLAYLQLADNPHFTPAFLRVVNVPRRGIGDKSVSDLVAAASRAGVPPMNLAERIIDGDTLPAGIKPAMKRNLAEFVGIVRKLRRAALKGFTVADLINLAVTKTEYEEHLRNTQQDFDQRWENVQELVNYSVVVSQEQERQDTADGAVAADAGFAPATTAPLEPMQAADTSGSEVRLHPIFQNTAAAAGPSRKSSRPATKKTKVKVEDDVVEILSSGDELDDMETPPSGGPPSSEVLTPLRFFLQSSMLSTDTEAQDDAAQVPKVTISTVHAAKGLEWPVVFIPAVEYETYPFYRCTEAHEIAEERRLLYVAMTRAQSFLTLTHTVVRMSGGKEEERGLCPFVDKSLKKDSTLFTSTLPPVDAVIRRQISTMLGRPPPDEEATQEAIMKHVRAAPPLSTWDAPESRGFNRFSRNDGPGAASRSAEYWRGGVDEYALGASGPGFASASSTYASSRTRAFGGPMPQPAPAIPRPPQPPIRSANRNLPEPVPFTFDGSPNKPRPEANLTSFTSSSSSSLAAMKALGAGLSDTMGATPKPTPTLSSFTSGSNSSFAAMKALGLPASAAPGSSTTPARNASSLSASSTVASGNASSSDASGVATGVQLARGTKRLGMGRPAPWGSKRAKS